ncbi:MAG: NAD-dependent epimerase/dehydratase family protein [Candidatus Moduliflexus flocculans]|nr:NAD-dependent epimerase/dehydratase family protein [Candidatus Moduliflexus flocculans]
MARYLVTGGAGFIGSHIAESARRARGRGPRPGQPLDREEENLASVADRIEFVEGDIRDLATCRRAVEGVETVFHEAALASVAAVGRGPAPQPTPSTSPGTLNMLVAARDAGVRSFVLASSSAVYGDDPAMPKVEGREGRPCLALRRRASSSTRNTPRPSTPSTA